MSTLEFIEKIVASTVWPLFALGITLLLLPNIRELLSIVKKLKWGEVEAEVGRTLKDVREIIEATPAATQTISCATSKESDTSQLEYVQTLAELSPRSAVLEAWRGLETQVQAAHSTLYRNSAARPTARVLETLHKESRIDDATFEAVNILRGLRNRASHEDAFIVSTDDAIEFSLVARKVTEHLQQTVHKSTEAKS